METLQRLITNARNLWETWSLSQRVTVVTASVLSLLIVAGVGMWSTRPEMVQLASRLAPAEAAEAIAQLEASGIEYELSYSGSTILVDRADLNRARLAARDSLGEQADTDAIVDSVWADPNLQHARLQRQQEQRLAATLARFKAIKEAVVHISKPQPTPFIRDHAPTTASVIVDLAPGVSFSHHDATAVISLVSHSVEGLRPEDVALMDTSGRLLDSQQALRADVGGQLEYTRTLESHLAAKAEALLSQMLGPGRAIVRVTADVDFTETERVETTYDPDSKVKLSETIKSESHTGRAPTIGAGTQANLKPSPSLGSSNGVLTKIEENTTEYANTETRDTVKETPGRIKRLTVAAIVDLTPPEGDAEPAATSDVTTADVESLIKQAVGFDSQRNDEINVVASALAGSIDLVMPPVPLWEQYGPLLRQMSLALGAVLMFVMGLLILRRLRPVVVTTADATTSEESIRRLAELTIHARENPELVAQVLDNWLTDEPASGTVSQPPDVQRRPAA